MHRFSVRLKCMEGQLYQQHVLRPTPSCRYLRMSLHSKSARGLLQSHVPIGLIEVWHDHLWRSCKVAASTVK
jgi:hypothetical protein